jgi:hypothetical protein
MSCEKCGAAASYCPEADAYLCPLCFETWADSHPTDLNVIADRLTASLIADIPVMLSDVEGDRELALELVADRISMAHDDYAHIPDEAWAPVADKVYAAVEARVPVNRLLTTLN